MINAMLGDSPGKMQEIRIFVGGIFYRTNCIVRRNIDKLGKGTVVPENVSVFFTLAPYI